MTVDVYRKKTTDLLIEKNAALATGYEKGWANIGAVRNQGIEITLDATPILTKKWNWTLNANIGFNRSKVLDIGPGDEMGFDPGVIPGSGNFVMCMLHSTKSTSKGFPKCSVRRLPAYVREIIASATRTVTEKSLLPTSYYWEVANRISQAV